MSPQSLSALSIAPAAREWLSSSCRPRWLHVFDHACNLINERGEVLSIVSWPVGDGPFSLVVEDDSFIFSDFIDVRSQIIAGPGRITLGSIMIDAQDAAVSSPRPAWESLHACKDNVISQLSSLPLVGGAPSIPGSLLAALFAPLSAGDMASCLPAARALAGLGPGLTPAGDDVLLGAVLAAWILHPPGTAAALAEAIADAAAPLTTSLSAAWLRAAGSGQAGILWHRFFDALISRDRTAVQNSMQGILAVGHSSGADALAGFVGSLTFLPHTYDIPEYIR